MAVQLTFELELTDSLQEQGNSDLRGIKIGPRSCLKKYKVQSEREWAFLFVESQITKQVIITKSDN